MSSLYFDFNLINYFRNAIPTNVVVAQEVNLALIAMELEKAKG